MAGRQTVSAEAKPSGGHAGLVPSQTSTASQGPAAARQAVPLSASWSGGHVGLSPSQRSSRSQGPAAGRQMVSASSKVSPTQLGEPSGPHWMCPRSQGLPVSHAAPSSQAPQTSPLQNPPLQGVPTSAFASGGQLGASPSQRSSTSHSPSAGRQTTPASFTPAATHTGSPLLQSRRPNSQALPVSQGAPSSQARPPSVPPSSGGRPGTQSPLTQRSPRPHSAEVAQTPPSLPSSPPPHAVRPIRRGRVRRRKGDRRVMAP